MILSDKLIHLNFRERARTFRHTICTASASEDDAYEEFKSGFANVPSDDSPEYYSPVFRKRHVHCKTWSIGHDEFGTAIFRDDDGVVRPMLQLSMLGACRQLHEEGSFLLWTTNIFSFEDPLSLRHFSDHLKAVRIKNLKRIHVNTQWYSLALSEWSRLFSAKFFNAIPGLTTLHATFDENFAHPDLPVLLHRDAGNSIDFHLNQPLSRAQRLHLEHVTVTIGDDVLKRHMFLDPSFLDRHRWTNGKKRQVAEELRLKILNRKSQDGGF